MKIIVLKEPNASLVLENLCHQFCSYSGAEIVTSLSADVLSAADLLLLAADVNLLSENAFISTCLAKAFTECKEAFQGLQAGLIIVSKTIYFSKAYAKRLAFILNQYGCYFCGHSLFEVVEDYKNFSTWQKIYQLPLEEVCQKRLYEFYQTLLDKHSYKRKKLLALHASERSKSNTYALWRMVMANLTDDFDVRELHIENGEIIDCKGCDFNTCLHFAEQKSCYYGGQVTTEILPAIEEADIIVWVCPNYNDAVSAMHCALINRLTVLYRRIDLSPKQFYGIIVSANSGSDIVAQQLISALNFNKGFMLPANAFLVETANDAGTVQKMAGIETKAKRFADNIIAQSALA